MRLHWTGGVVTLIAGGPSNLGPRPARAASAKTAELYAMALLPVTEGDSSLGTRWAPRTGSSRAGRARPLRRCVVAAACCCRG